MKWIGLTGRAGAGKDYTYIALKNLLPEFHKVSFATPLRFDIQDSLGVEIPALWEKPLSEDARWLLQQWGTELRRQQDINFWVNQGEAAAHQVMEDGHSPIFTDVRFPNEADMIRDNGGIIVRVAAPSHIRKRRLGTLPPEHPSEFDMDDYPVDYTHTSLTDERFERSLHRVLVEANIDDLMEGIVESFQ